MQNYQLTILVSNKVDEKARTGLLDSLNKDLGSKNKSDIWGVRGLAYQINHEDKAFYAHFNFEADPSTIPSLDRKLKLNEDIIRYLLIKIDAKKASKAADEKKTVKATVDSKKAEKTEEKVNEVVSEASVPGEEVSEESK